MRDQHWIDPQPAVSGEIGRWLWQLQDTRQRTFESLIGIDQTSLDWDGSAGRNSIGTLLYHIAIIEADWLFVEIREEEFPQSAVELFPWDVRDSSRRLTVVEGISLDEHLTRLQKTRGFLTETLSKMQGDDFLRKRTLEKYDVTPEWVLHHLTQHEAEHRGEIGLIRLQAEHQLQNQG